MDRKQYSPEELEHIKKHWRADPPQQCTGNCDIKCFHLEDVCVACGWCDESLPATGSNEYEKQ